MNKIDIKFERPTIYVSHPIRGTSGDMKKNCDKALESAEILRDLYPHVNWYIPAEHDLELQILYTERGLTEEDILYADCRVLENCDGWCWLKWEDSHGSFVELQHAQKCGLNRVQEIHPGYIITTDCIINVDLCSIDIIKILRIFNPIVNNAIERFNKKEGEKKNNG